ncbi:adhesion G-protein coupled receptor D1 [Lethenteron reissneri]|uniref:adhesion G-protein coupled receptor D1 n=1 Tax=Lethenteron reissneri TaxID=7753 RepID=UPI002AB68D33|nr:adhesion G-protein coupled receptor D1 [Lethenteron reissneri]
MVPAWSWRVLALLLLLVSCTATRRAEGTPPREEGTLDEADIWPGLSLVYSASRYWPLGRVPGLLEAPGPRDPTEQAEVTPSSRLVELNTTAETAANGSTRYSSLEATVELVDWPEGRGVLLLLRGSGSATALLPHAAREARESCVSQPALCSPRGVTLSLFWKRTERGSHAAQLSSSSSASSSSSSTASSTSSSSSFPSRRPPSPSGFSISVDPERGSAEILTFVAAWRWQAEARGPGAVWSHLLFTWSRGSGLRVFVNGTPSAWDPRGAPCRGRYGASPGGGLVLAAGSPPSPLGAPAGDVAFDEVIVWERRLTAREVRLYFTAATGADASLAAKPGATLPTAEPGGRTSPPGASRGLPGGSGQLSQEGTAARLGSGRAPGAGRDLGHLGALVPNLPDAHAISPDVARNLTQSFLGSVEDVLLSPVMAQFSQAGSVVSGLLLTVDEATSRVASRLGSSSGGPITIRGRTDSADFALVKVPGAWHLHEYRFPAHGASYIFIPGTAFPAREELTIVGLLYHSVHRFYRRISPSQTRVSGALQEDTHRLEVVSRIISLKTQPPPRLSSSLSGSPLVTVVLLHEREMDASNSSLRVQLWCAFLDFSLEPQGVWSNAGCARTQGNGSFSVCKCTHLTNFAILMQVTPLQLSEHHQRALSTISYVGCAISITCLCITLITFAILSSVSTIRNQRYLIHANLSLAILLAQVFLLISGHFSPGTLGCKVLSVLLHFLYLSAFAWMLVEGLHLYSMVVKVFGSEDSSQALYYGIGWGAPLIISIVSVSSALGSYGEESNCWLSITGGAIWAFVAPALCVIAVNIVILVTVTRIITRISAENYRMHGDLNSFRLTVKAVAVLLPILGISWLFGVLAVNESTVLFQYLFAIFNSLQGGFIFLFHCLLNSEVRAAFKHKTKVWTLNSSTGRPIRPLNSDVLNGNRTGIPNTKLNMTEKSSQLLHNTDNRTDPAQP